MVNEGERCITYSVVGVLRVHTNLSHSHDQCLGGVKNVFIDDSSEREQFVFRVTILVDNLHLFDDCRFSRFTGSFRDPSAHFFAIKKNTHLAVESYTPF